MNRFSDNYNRRVADARLDLGRVREELAELRLGTPDVLVHDLGPGHDRDRAAAQALGEARREAALDCGVTGSRYPNGPYEPFSWVFNREPEKGAFARDFKRHFPSLKPVHVGQSLGDAVDLRPLVEARREALKEEMLGTLKGLGDALLPPCRAQPT